MIEIFNKWCNGYVLTPVALSCADVLSHIQRQPSSYVDIKKQYHLCDGPLKVSLRSLESLSWLTRDNTGIYHITKNANYLTQIPPELLDLYQIPVEQFSYKIIEPTMQVWVNNIQNQWALSKPLLADMLDGVFFIPLFK